MSKDGRSEYSVGYGKPPLQSKFKPGRSGNPSGRPKKQTINIVDQIEKELGGLITINSKGKPQRITKFRAILMQLINMALKGDHRAMAIVIRLLEPGAAADQTDNLSPVLREMRAIHAMHNVTSQNAVRTADNTELTRNTENDCADKN